MAANWDAIHDVLLDLFNDNVSVSEAYTRILAFLDRGNIIRQRVWELYNGLNSFDVTVREFSLDVARMTGVEAVERLVILSLVSRQLSMLRAANIELRIQAIERLVSDAPYAEMIRLLGQVKLRALHSIRNAEVYLHSLV